MLVWETGLETAVCFTAVGEVALCGDRGTRPLC